MSTKKEDTKGPSKEKSKTKSTQQTSASFMSLVNYIKELNEHTKVIHLF